jgi:hypothetical protein
VNKAVSEGHHELQSDFLYVVMPMQA